MPINEKETPKKKMFKTTATFCEVGVAVGCWVLSLTTNYRDFSAIVSSAAPKKVCLFRHTSKTQGIGVGDRSRKMVLSRSLGAWSRFAHHCNDLLIYGEHICAFPPEVGTRYFFHSAFVNPCTVCCKTKGQWWANLDQAPEDLDRNIFRDLSPTPKP